MPGGVLRAFRPGRGPAGVPKLLDCPLLNLIGNAGNTLLQAVFQQNADALPGTGSKAC
jgi:hypothetical protein